MIPSWLPGWGNREDDPAGTNRESQPAGAVSAQGHEPDVDHPAPAGEQGSASQPGEGEATKPLTEENVMEALKEVYDPELAINIVDLGLVYGVEIDGNSVGVKMTLTSPGCPVGPMLQALAHGAVQRSFGVEDVKVEIVWIPPWDPYTMASEEAKDMLGIW